MRPQPYGCYFNTTIIIDRSPLEQLATAADEDVDDEIEVEVEYTPGWHTPGRYYGPPEDCYPDEGEDPEILSVTDEHGKDYLKQLTSNQLRRLVLLACEAQAQDERDAEIEAAEARGGYDGWPDDF